jgi:diguanylate cyclase (GGDEF)-like protein/putative nucleotidyltransferase with HDIG domain
VVLGATGKAANSERRLFLRAAAVAGIAASLVLLSAFALSAARESARTSRDVRSSTSLWNAYQQARYSILREELLTQEFRLAASPYFEGQFATAAADLSRALGEVTRAGRALDQATAAEVEAANRRLQVGIRRLVDAVNQGEAAKAERIATETLNPLFASAASAINRGASAHHAASTAGLRAAERAEFLVLGTASAIFILCTLLAAATVVAIRFRRRLDTARRAELTRLKEAALTDSLTGVLNHRAFHEHLSDALTGVRVGESTTVVMLDLDGLKEVNDSYGHQVGDAQIRHLAGTAADVVSGQGGVYRLGGDEFALILLTCSEAEALSITDRIHGEFVARTALDVGFAAGIAGSDGVLDKDELARRADVALIEAKRLRAAALVYSPLFESAVHGQPPESHHVAVLAQALARAVDTKDAYTRSHCETVAELCRLIATDLNLEPGIVLKIRLAGLLHDVGKIGVPDVILHKPDRLTKDEFEKMKSHPVLGAHILAAAERPEEANWVLRHHERLDGMGYPHGLTEHQIPLEAKIIAVADAFEAMTSQRPYRDARSVKDALAELHRCVGTQFDARCVAALSRVFAEGKQEHPGARVDHSAKKLFVPLGAEAA